MGAVATFTLRDLNRRPAKVLAAVRKFGQAEICARTGEVFTLAPKAKPKKARKTTSLRSHFEELWQKQRDVGLVPPPESENERINRIIAGEE